MEDLREALRELRTVVGASIATLLPRRLRGPREAAETHPGLPPRGSFLSLVPDPGPCDPDLHLFDLGSARCRCGAQEWDVDVDGSLQIRDTATFSPPLPPMPLDPDRPWGIA